MIITTKKRAASANAPELVLLHAFPLSSKMWEPLIHELSDLDITIATMNVPGFGNEPSREWTMPEYARELRDALYQHGITRPILCGLSMGGYLALAFLKQFFGEVRGLILADTRATADSEEVRNVREKMIAAALSGEPIMSDVEQLARATSKHTRDQHPERFQMLHAMTQEASAEAFANALRAMSARADSTPLLGMTSVHVLVICGEDDALSPVTEMGMMADRIPNARFAIIPRAGHYSAVEQPQAFAEHVTSSFLHVFSTQCK
jgi:3-oxoadipate enol-lactonase